MLRQHSRADATLVLHWVCMHFLRSLTVAAVLAAAALAQQPIETAPAATPEVLTQKANAGDASAATGCRGARPTR